MFTKRIIQSLTEALRLCLVASLIAGVALAVQPARPALAQSAEDGFNPGANSGVYALAVQADGKLVVGGDFTTLGGQTRNYIGRLNPDGSIDTTFNPGANSGVNALAVQADGKIVVGGDFTTLGGQARNNIGRLNPDGSLDTTFNPGANSGVNALAVQADGKIVVVGGFTTLGGQTRNYIGRLNVDGSLDTTFNPGANSGVYALAVQADGKIVVGGDFTTLGGQTRNKIGRLNVDGTLDTAYNPGASGAVIALAVQADGKLVVGGGFTTLGGQARNYIGRLNPDGSLDTTFNPGASSTIIALAVQADGKIVVGGNFTTLGGQPRNYIGRLNPNGTLDATFNPGADDLVRTLAVQADGKIVVGGDFTTLGGQTRNNIGRLNPDGSLDTSFNPGANDRVRALAVQADGKLVVGGYFTTLGGQARNNIGRLNPDGSLDTSFNPGASGAVIALAVQADGKIVVGGGFTTLGGQTRNHIGRLNPDGSLDTTFDPGANDWVYALAVQADGKIVVGGLFTTLGGQMHNYIGRLNPDGSLDTTFNPGANNGVNALAVQADGKIVVGGVFTTLSGQARNYIGRLNVDGTLDTAYNPGAGATVYALVMQADGKIVVGGLFTTLVGQTRNYIGRLNVDGTLDTSFNPEASSAVISLAVQADGKIVVGGGFTTLGGQTRNYIGRLNTDGSLDTSFNPGANDLVYSLALQADGKLVVGGNFTTLGGQTRNYIGRLSSDTAALQNLSVGGDGASVTWARSGAGPEVGRVTFEQSTDGGSTYAPLGAGTRIAGGWQLGGLALPVGQNIFIRARGYYSTGELNGSGSVVESVRNTFLTQAPAITSANSTTFVAGAAGSFTVTATGVPTPTITWSGSLPSGVTFSDNGNGTAALAGTPAPGTGGVYALTFTASNGALPDATQSFTLTVQEGPAITSANSTTFVAGTAGSFTVTATGVPTPAITWSGSLPSGVTFSDNGNGTAALAGTPAPGTGGVYALTFTASNGILPDATQNFTLTVHKAPAITSANSTTFVAGAAGSFTVTATGVPTPTITWSGSLPSGVTFSDNGNGTAALAGTPAPGTGGVYALTFTASNGILPNATQSFTLTVHKAPAITSANSTTFVAGAAGSFTVTATGVPTPTITWSGSLPSGVTFSDNGNGTAALAGTPASGTAGVYALTFTASNGILPDATQSFTLTVHKAPAITSANSTMFTIGTAGSFTVTATGVPTPTITWSGSLPSGVTFSDNGNGTAALAGTPAPGTGGVYALTFTASNGVLPNATQSFTLTVQEGPAITSANSTTFVAGAAGSFTVTATGVPTPTITWSGSLPSGVTFSDNGNGTAALAGTPASGTVGVYALTFTASNGVLPNATQNFTLTVQEGPAITSANSTTFVAGAAGSFTVTATGVPTPTITWSGSLPSGVTFSDNGNGTAALAGTPAPGTAGVYALTFTASNGVLPNATQNFTLTVQEGPAITSANSTTFVAGAAGSFTVTATGVPTPTITWSGSLPSGVTFSDNGNGTAALAGTPAPGTGGVYALTFTASNGVLPDATQNFTFTVQEGPAITSANSTMFVAGVAGSFTVTATGVPTPTITWSGSLPSGVTFSDNGNGTATLAGTPAPGTGGVYVLTFTASNGVLPNATQNFTLTVGIRICLPLIRK